MKNFEDFPVYKRALDLLVQVFEFVKHHDFQHEFEFKNQLKRAVISITNNIAEGSEYNNNRQLIRYLKIAKGSCGEVKNLVIISQRLEFGDCKKADEMYHITKEVSSQLSNFIKYLTENLEHKHQKN